MATKTKFKLTNSLHFHRDSKYVYSKYSGPEIAHHSNLSPILYWTIADWSRTAQIMVMIDLDQVLILDFWQGPDLNNQQFLELETLL